jgi:hypothetical protein
MIHPDNFSATAGDRHMAKAKLRFTERDVSRAIRAATKAGVQIGRVVVDTAGNIVVIAADATPTETFGSSIAQSGQSATLNGGAP